MKSDLNIKPVFILYILTFCAWGILRWFCLKQLKLCSAFICVYIKAVLYIGKKKTARYFDYKLFGKCLEDDCYLIYSIYTLLCREIEKGYKKIFIIKFSWLPLRTKFQQTKIMSTIPIVKVKSNCHRQNYILCFFQKNSNNLSNRQ